MDSVIRSFVYSKHTKVVYLSTSSLVNWSGVFFSVCFFFHVAWEIIACHTPQDVMMCGSHSGYQTWYKMCKNVWFGWIVSLMVHQWLSTTKPNLSTVHHHINAVFLESGRAFYLPEESTCFVFICLFNIKNIIIWNAQQLYTAFSFSVKSLLEMLIN